MPHLQSCLFAALAVAAVPLAAPVHAVTSSAPARAITSSAYILAADDGVMVHEAWARPSAGTSTTGAAYVTLLGGQKADSLVGVSTPVAATAEVHETINDNGVMKMRSAGPIPIAPGQKVTFAPGGMHIMLMGLKHKLVAGQSFPLTLTFAHAAPVTVDVKVQPRGHAGSMTGHDHMQMQ